MRLNGTLLDLASAITDEVGYVMTGWRRRIEVHENRVTISVLASPDVAGIGIGAPDPEVTVYCEPRPMSVGPINLDGWLALDFLEPGHVYWLEPRAFGAVSVEREDGDRDSAWYTSPVSRAPLS